MSLNFMLIDDSEIDLIVNRKSIEKVVNDAEILTFIRAEKAMTYLSSLSERPSSDFMIIPDIIFVDLNMPEMDGFDFLDAFLGLDDWKLQKVKTYILSSSTDVKDFADAQKHKACHGFLSKPLTSRMVQQTINGLYLAECQNK